MPDEFTHIVMYSGGIGSWAAARRVIEKHGADNVKLLFTDTRIEDQDLYRFLRESAASLGAELIEIADGRTPWELFFSIGYMGNTRADPCSKVLKRDIADRWLKEHYTPENCIVYVGIDWSEQHRFLGNDKGKAGLQKRKLPWKYEAPLIEAPYLTKEDIIEALEQSGIAPPRLYKMGFPHNNCGGFCIKTGHAQFELLYRAFPDRFKHHEKMEQRFREMKGRDLAILRDRRGGVTKPFPLSKLRERIEKQPDLIDKFDFGGCGCFIDD